MTSSLVSINTRPSKYQLDMQSRRQVRTIVIRSEPRMRPIILPHLPEWWQERGKARPLLYHHQHTSFTWCWSLYTYIITITIPKRRLYRVSFPWDAQYTHDWWLSLSTWTTRMRSSISINMNMIPHSTCVIWSMHILFEHRDILRSRVAKRMRNKNILTWMLYLLFWETIRS